MSDVARGYDRERVRGQTTGATQGCRPRVGAPWRQGRVPGRVARDVPHPAAVPVRRQVALALEPISATGIRPPGRRAGVPGSRRQSYLASAERRTEGIGLRA